MSEEAVSNERPFWERWKKAISRAKELEADHDRPHYEPQYEVASERRAAGYTDFSSGLSEIDRKIYDLGALNHTDRSKAPQMRVSLWPEKSSFSETDATELAKKLNLSDADIRRRYDELLSEKAEFQSSRNIAANEAAIEDLAHGLVARKEELAIPGQRQKMYEKINESLKGYANSDYHGDFDSAVKQVESLPELGSRSGRASLGSVARALCKDRGNDISELIKQAHKLSYLEDKPFPEAFAERLQAFGVKPELIETYKNLAIAHEEGRAATFIQDFKTEHAEAIASFEARLEANLKSFLDRLEQHGSTTEQTVEHVVEETGNWLERAGNTLKRNPIKTAAGVGVAAAGSWALSHALRKEKVAEIGQERQ